MIIVPTTSLVEQLFKDFKDYGWSPERNVHRIYQGHEKDTNKPVVISTWQSIYNLPKNWFKQYGMILGDEAHLFKAVSLTKIMTNLKKCPYRVGLTGTLDGSKTHKLVLEGLFGSVNKVVSTTELMEKGKLSELKIYCLVLKHDKNTSHYMKDKTYQEEMDFLVANEKRNVYIRNLCKGLQGNSLCLFQYVEKHGKQLYEDNGSFFGDLSAILIDNMPLWAEFSSTPSNKVSLMSEWESKLMAIIQESTQENVTSLAGVPSWMLVLLNLTIYLPLEQEHSMLMI